MNKITQRLDIRQGQNLVMTPQLQQAIKLLQLNNMELAEFIEQELEKNPLLEKEDSSPDVPVMDESDPPAANDDGPDEVQAEFDEGWTGNEAETRQSDSAHSDFDPGSSMADIGSGGNLRFEDGDDAFDARLSRPKTLREHLNEQVLMQFSDPRDRALGGVLVDLLDEAGYLRANIEDLAQQLGAPLERVQAVLTVVKKFDPAGVFAADLAECLALQLEERGGLDQPMRLLLQNLHLLGAHDYAALRSICGVNETYLKDMIAEIKALNPKPANNFEHLVVQTAIPDVLMKRLPKNLGGGWRVELNAETLPKVLINQQYYTEVAQHAKAKKDKEYLAGQMQNASWLVRAMDQRAQTILKVASELVEQQEAFFNYGIEFLRPLTLKDIATVIDMHESTVSRVTTNKYIGTPRGIFELKFFFSTALESADGISHSSEAIKARIKTMIDAEDPKDILSDDTIVEKLKADGIDIARRTVAKYREGLHIGSSVQRRKEKRLNR
jgi:RNA polymerase sigma-54 factor